MSKPDTDSDSDAPKTLNGAITAVVRAIEFPCEPWVLRGEPGQLPTEILPVSGTWTLAPQQLWSDRGIKGILSCPRCGAATLIPGNMGIQLDKSDGRVLPEFRCNKCEFVCRAILKDWDLRKLYCTIYVVMVDGKLDKRKEYSHAISEAEARFFFKESHKNDSPPVTEVVGTAPVIGLWVNDKQGKDLSTD